jgi:protein involved in polysaccharide export with SLBB domain
LLAVAMAACSPVVKPQYQHPERFATWTDSPPEFLIGTGDDLSVVMPYNPELNFEGSVGPDGRFTIPVVGTVIAGGKTVEQVEDNINKALVAKHISMFPDSSVSIRHYSEQVYVGGEVKNPGAVTLQGPMDPLQAVSVAGGLLDTARSKEIVIIRHGPDGRPMMRTVNIDHFIHTGDPNEDVALQSLDIIFVPKSSIAEVDLWVDQFINKPLPFYRSFDYTISDSTTTTTGIP